MSLVTVGIGDLAVTGDPRAVIVTHGLGSCIALVAWDPGLRVGGMLHFQLPASALSPERALDAPGTFADTGIPLLFHRLYARGCRKEALVVKAAGGGSFNDRGGAFDIGRRNHAAMWRILRHARVAVVAEDVGGSRSRTVRLFLDSGRVTVQSGDQVAPL
ncbi:chemotaxis protein CheD [Anaeromyxobacter dehalogenans]|uniref:Probable chemoreceptor glutamine deamidase CheD 2 n=1 Tax=Anaeromyxobacter dehalogenans (strain 2CP-C) TaxID=290397 RepID=CHED2_ANADE|nr:chemotaxis protein CheD [Anaeromyxobacter dehalogenans]Q2IQR1.1 RecName: Full=Probable chemoreceptor glutamine deamidase CheD 2 [Anaeromyxobacter dehalogenans 2CP-C]ABC81146.1 CheD [Anaeromyxobacter dehalogenans 2CP-C]